MKYKVINKWGEALELPFSGILMRVCDDLASSHATISTGKYGTRGTRFKSATLDERPVLLSGYIQENVEANRDVLNNYFPTGTDVVLHVITHNKNVHATFYVESVETFPSKRTTEFQISLIAPDPFLRDDEKVLVFAGANESVEALSESVYDIEPDITINVNSDCDGIILKNNGKIFSVNYAFSGGDVITVDIEDCRCKLTRDGAVINLYNYTSNFDALLITKGNNTFTCEQDATVTIKYSNIYLGV